MRVRGVISFVVLGGLVSTLLGCSNDDFQRRMSGRWGPKPVIQADDANTMLTNQLTVLGYINTYAHIGVSLSAAPDPRWYNIAEWGFNIGRADCTIYLDNLFILARERTRTNGLLLDISAAATAIVTATAPHSVALSIIAPAFGLAGNVSNRIFDSYLFSDTSPGLIQSKVRDLQDAFQDTIRKNQDQINTSAAAYAAIQNYYNICLPQSIEGVLLEKIATSTATATDPGVAPKPTVVTTPSGTTTVKSVPAARTVTPKMSLQ
jgi:hypothetical protein